MYRGGCVECEHSGWQEQNKLDLQHDSIQCSEEVQQGKDNASEMDNKAEEVTRGRRDAYFRNGRSSWQERVTITLSFLFLPPQPPFPSKL